MSTKKFRLLESTEGQRVANTIFGIADIVDLDLNDKILDLIKAARLPENLGFLSVLDITEVNHALDRADAILLDLQLLLGEHGEGWEDLMTYFRDGTNRALDAAVTEMEDFLRRAKVPKILHGKYLAEARASVDNAYYDKIAQRIANLRNLGINGEDIDHTAGWNVARSKCLDLYRERLQLLTPRQATNLAVAQVIYDLENELNSRGVDIDNLRKAMPTKPSADGLMLYEN